MSSLHTVLLKVASFRDSFNSLFPPGEVDPRAAALFSLLGAAGGGGMGALVDRKRRGRGALIGASLGGLGGLTAANLIPGARLPLHAGGPAAINLQGADSPSRRTNSPLVNRVAEFLQGNKKDPDFRWGTLGGLIPAAPAFALQMAYKPIISSGHGPKYQALYDNLKQQALAGGNNVVTGKAPMYNGVTKEITMREPIPSLLAHEMGHARGWKGHMVTQPLGKMVHGLGTAGALMAHDEDSGLTAAGIGTAGYAPVLLSELDASAKGYRLLRNAGVGRAGSLGSFKGVPTYLLNALLPLASYYTKKEMGGYDPSLRKD